MTSSAEKYGTIKHLRKSYDQLNELVSSPSETSARFVNTHIGLIHERAQIVRQEIQDKRDKYESEFWPKTTDAYYNDLDNLVTLAIDLESEIYTRLQELHRQEPEYHASPARICEVLTSSLIEASDSNWEIIKDFAPNAEKYLAREIQAAVHDIGVLSWLIPPGQTSHKGRREHDYKLLTNTLNKLRQREKGTRSEKAAKPEKWLGHDGEKFTVAEMPTDAQPYVRIDKEGNIRLRDAVKDKEALSEEISNGTTQIKKGVVYSVDVDSDGKVKPETMQRIPQVSGEEKETLIDVHLDLPPTVALDDCGRPVMCADPAHRNGNPRNPKYVRINLINDTGLPERVFKKLAIYTNLDDTTPNRSPVEDHVIPADMQFVRTPGGGYLTVPVHGRWTEGKPGWEEIPGRVVIEIKDPWPKSWHLAYGIATLLTAGLAAIPWVLHNTYHVRTHLVAWYSKAGERPAQND